MFGISAAWSLFERLVFGAKKILIESLLDYWAVGSIWEDIASSNWYPKYSFCAPNLLKATLYIDQGDIK